MGLSDRIESAIVCGIKGGPLVAAVGFAGHMLGNWLYPQPMEQVPSDLLLVPFGFFVGFLIGFVAELFLPASGTGGLWGVLLLVSLAYGGCNYDYAKGRAIPPGILVDFEPYAGTAVGCGSSCPPGTEWTVEGQVRVRAVRVEGTVTAMTISSSALPRDGRNTLTLEEAFAAIKGPQILLGENDIAGDRHLKPNDVRLYPIRYSYRNRTPESARELFVSVYLADTDGNQQCTTRSWHVR